MLAGVAAAFVLAFPTQALADPSPPATASNLQSVYDQAAALASSVGVALPPVSDVAPIDPPAPDQTPPAQGTPAPEAAPAAPPAEGPEVPVSPAVSPVLSAPAALDPTVPAAVPVAPDPVPPPPTALPPATSGATGVSQPAPTKTAPPTQPAPSPAPTQPVDAKPPPVVSEAPPPAQPADPPPQYQASNSSGINSGKGNSAAAPTTVSKPDSSTPSNQVSNTPSNQMSNSPQAPSDIVPLTTPSTWVWNWNWNCKDDSLGTSTFSPSDVPAWVWNWNWNCDAATPPATSPLDCSSCNTNISIRLFSPGDDGDVVQTNTASTTSLAANLSSTLQSATFGRTAAPVTVPPGPIVPLLPAPIVPLLPLPVVVAAPSEASPAPITQPSDTADVSVPTGAGQPTLATTGGAPAPSENAPAATAPAAPRADTTVISPKKAVGAMPRLSRPSILPPMSLARSPATWPASEPIAAILPRAALTSAAAEPAASISAGVPAKTLRHPQRRLPSRTPLPLDSSLDFSSGFGGHNSSAPLNGGAVLLGTLLFLASGLAQWLWVGAERRLRGLHAGRPERPG